MGGQFVVGALSFVYESDLRASLRDYLIFVLAAVFAFALERLVDCIAKRESGTDQGNMLQPHERATTTTSTMIPINIRRPSHAPLELAARSILAFASPAC
jgi:hypothetical protein